MRWHLRVSANTTIVSEVITAMKPSIVNVGALDSDYFSVSLSNGHIMLFRLVELAKEPDFAALMQTKSYDNPKTDGERLYWTVDGPSLYFEEIMKLAVG